MITSVGNLLTIVLVLFSDVLLGGATDVVTIWSLIGAGGQFLEILMLDTVAD